MMSELQLLKGIPIEVETLKVYPLTLNEIVNMGERTYNVYIKSLMLRKSEIDKEFINPEMWDEFLKMDDYDFFILFMYKEVEIRKIILSSLSLFIKESVSFDLEKGLYIDYDDGDFIITKEIFNRIKEVIMEQNFISNGETKKEEFNPYDDKARELIEKRNKFKKMIQEANASEGLNLGDIISIVACHSNTYDFYNIWDLTVYHLYTIYLRMAMKDQYETHIYFLPHSSKNQSNDIKHWMSKINKNN